MLTQNGTNVAFALSATPVFSSVSIFNGPSLTTNGISAGGKTIRNVAPGVNATDAVTLNQFNAAVGAIAAPLQARIDDVGNKAYAGVASAMAMESPPYIPGKTTMTAGAGYYQGQGGAAVALRRTADNGRWSVVGGVAPSSGGVAARLGVSGVLQ
ncbi:MAG: YadA-like family protein [Proteobacteria bacterium]|nr:YadA-like family protein [Pseudomonadota bacterium]